MVDSQGNVLIPLSGVSFPDATIPSPIGDVIVRVEALTDATGILYPITGDATLAISVRARLINQLLPPDCAITPISPLLTTGMSGALTGVPYDQTNGTATYVSNDFSVPRSSGCGAFGGALDDYLGLPSGAGNNEMQFVSFFDPIITGS
jgi:hypothetical protein